jgi:hypothetical protein
MNQTIYRVLHIYESDYGCEEHAEPTAEVVLETAARKPFPIPMPHFTHWIFSRVTALRIQTARCKKSSRNRIRNQKGNTTPSKKGEPIRFRFALFALCGVAFKITGFCRDALSFFLRTSPHLHGS